MKHSVRNEHSVVYKHYVLNVGCFACCLFLMLAAMPAHASGLGGLLKSLPKAMTGSTCDQSTGDTCDQSGSGGLGNLLQGLQGSTGSTGSGGTKPNVGDLFKKAQEMQDKMTMGPVDHHYLGRLNASMLLEDGFLPPNSEVVQYIRSLLMTLARYSRVPYVYDDYIPIVIKTDVPNAWAAPGGFIIITEGLLKMVQSEDELALILSHEMGHIEHNHGVNMIMNDLAMGFMSDFVGDIGAGEGMKQFAKGVMKYGADGYDVELEMEADARALFIAQQAGYDPNVFPRVMERLKKVTGHYGGKGYPPQRSKLIRQELKKYRYLGSPASVDLRTTRFKKRMVGGQVAVSKPVKEKKKKTVEKKTVEKKTKKKSTGGTADDK